MLWLDGLEKMGEAHEAALGEGLPSAYIVDAGRTEFEGPTPTVVGIGPCRFDELPERCKRSRTSRGDRVPDGGEDRPPDTVLAACHPRSINARQSGSLVMSKVEHLVVMRYEGETEPSFTQALEADAGWSWSDVATEAVELAMRGASDDFEVVAGFMKDPATGIWAEIGYGTAIPIPTPSARSSSRPPRKGTRSPSASYRPGRRRSARSSRTSPTATPSPCRKRRHPSPRDPENGKCPASSSSTSSRTTA